jgi:hypothetical protein
MVVVLSSFCASGHILDHHKWEYSRVGDNADSSALGFRAFTGVATGTAAGAEDFFAMRGV